MPGLVRPALAALVWLSLALPLALGAAPARAQDLEVEDPFELRDYIGDERMLGGHVFIPSVATEFALVTTSFGSLTGFGLQTVDLGVDDTGTDLGTIEIASFEEQFQVGVRITEWIGVRLDVAGTVGIGTDEKSALIAGANFAGGFGLGPIVRLFETDDFILSATLRGGYLLGAIISPLAFGNEALNTGQLNRDTLLTNASQWTVAPAVAMAYAPIEHLGLQASTRLTAAGLKTEGVDTDVSTSLDLGVTATFDAVRLFAPVAALLTYGVEVPLEGGDPVHGIEGGLFYSGLKHLNLGAALAGTIGAQESVLYAQLRIAHYW